MSVPPTTTQRAAQPTLFHDLCSVLEPLPIATMFPSNQPLEIELGAGDGSFTAEYANRNPGINLIAVERLLGRLRKLDKKGLRAGLTNLRLLCVEAAYLTQYLLAANSVQAIHVYFPDPWPKKRHRKHRLIAPAFACFAASALKVGGVVHLRTDDQDYFSQMVEVFDGNTSFLRIETPAELAAITTDFEREFNSRGIATLRASYQIGPLPKPW